MKCRSCGRQIPHSDNHCVYCGARTGPLPLRVVLGLSGRLPTWVKLLTGFAFIVGIAALIATMALNGSSSSPNPPLPVLPGPTVTGTEPPVPSFRLNEPSGAPIAYSTVNSDWAVSLPIIDGILTPGEWTGPPFTKSFEYLIGNVSKTGEMVGYFMNDDEYLYIAVTASAEDFKEGGFNKIEMEGVYFSLYLHFDNDNDGILEQGEDIKGLEMDIWDALTGQGYYYHDSYTNLDWIAEPTEDDVQNGEASMAYPGNTSCLTYEFRIPLNTGDPNDLAVNPGDTTGVKVRLVEGQAFYMNSGPSMHSVASVGWPVGRGLIDGSTYGKLVLATAQQPLGPELKWSYDIGGTIASSPTVGPDGIIYVAAQEGKVYAINPGGTVKWSFDTLTANDSMTMWYSQLPICGSPTIGADGTIYVGCCNGPLLVLGSDGVLMRSYAEDISGISDSLAVGSDGTMYVSSGLVFAFDTDGSLKWSYPRIADATNVFYESPVLGDDGTIYAVSGAGKLYASYRGGLLKWVYDAKCPTDFSPAVGTDGTIYVGCQSGVRAVDSNGILKWAYNCGDDDRLCYIQSSPVIAKDGTVYTTYSDGLIKIDGNGNVVWEFSADEQTDQYWVSTDQSQIAISDEGSVYMVSHRNVESYSEEVGRWQFSDLGIRLDAFTLGGVHKWTYNIEKPGQYSLAIGPAGRIYLCSEDGVLYAFEDTQ